jgi:ATP-binding cassette subfamily B protein
MRLNGYYASLVRRQHRGLIENDVDASAAPRTPA